MAKAKEKSGKNSGPAGAPAVRKDTWRSKLSGRAEIMKYLQTAQRYWYSEEWFGSEKRKTPA